jgi:hypothetical protein
MKGAVLVANMMSMERSGGEWRRKLLKRMKTSDAPNQAKNGQNEIGSHVVMWGIVQPKEKEPKIGQNFIRESKSNESA